MCESDYYGEGESRFTTLSEAVNEAMQAGRTYAEVLSVAREWVAKHRYHYLSTMIEERGGLPYLVVRTCPDISLALRSDSLVEDVILVPQSFLRQATAAFLYQQS